MIVGGSCPSSPYSILRRLWTEGWLLVPRGLSWPPGSVLVGRFVFHRSCMEGREEEGVNIFCLEGFGDFQDVSRRESACLHLIIR